jgi:hypothetical protein
MTWPTVADGHTLTSQRSAWPSAVDECPHWSSLVAERHWRRHQTSACPYSRANGGRSGAPNLAASATNRSTLSCPKVPTLDV